MEKVFGMRYAKLLCIIYTFQEAFYKMALPYLFWPMLFASCLPYYAGLVSGKSELAISNVWGFINGMLRKTCHPKYFQKAAYSGHKQCHGIKFQSVLAPDGLLVALFGPVAGSCH